MIAYDSGIKHAGILLCAFIVYVIAMPEQFGRHKKIVGGVMALMIGASMAVLRQFVQPMHVLALLILFMVFMGVYFEQEPKKNITLSLISYGFSYAAYYITVIVSILCAVCLSYATGDQFGSSLNAMKYYTHLMTKDSTVKVLYGFFIVFFQILTEFFVLRSKRIRNGLSFLVKAKMSDVGVYISIAIISIVAVHTIFSLSPLRHHNVGAIFIFFGIICIFMMYYWVKSQIRTAYTTQMQEKELLLLEKSITEKDHLIEKLRGDNERLSCVIHKDNKLIPAMVMSVKKCAEDIQSGSCDPSGALETAKELEAIYGERSAALSQYETHRSSIASTGVTAVDAVLLYMSDKSAECGVAFHANLEADVAQMLSEAIDRREFDTMLADLTENAIISAKHISPGSVAVNLKKQDGWYSFEVLDSGEYFSTDVLRHMGIKRITTHKQEGGSGIGLMTFFKILRHNSASLTIEEYQHGNAYSKAVRVTFDHAGRRRILTHRAVELKKALRSGRFEIAAKDCSEERDEVK